MRRLRLMRPISKAYRGFGEERPVDVEGEVEHPGLQSVGRVTIKTAQLPVTPKLISALPGKSQGVVRSLSPQGTIDAQLEGHDAIQELGHSPPRAHASTPPPLYRNIFD